MKKSLPMAEPAPAPVPPAAPAVTLLLVPNVMELMVNVAVGPTKMAAA
jgi:hypothetical protein